MNLHFEMQGLDWSGTSAQALSPNTDLFAPDASDEVIGLYEDAVELLPALMNNAYAALWVCGGTYDLLVYSVSESGASFPADQANAGLDVVLVSDDEVIERDQMVGLETAAEALFDVLSYADRRGCVGSEYTAPGTEPLSMVVADRGDVAPYFPSIETLTTDESRDARWLATRGGGLNFPSDEYLVFPGPYWPIQDSRHTEEFTDVQRAEMHETLSEHSGRSLDPEDADAIA